MVAKNRFQGVRHMSQCPITGCSTDTCSGIFHWVCNQGPQKVIPAGSLDILDFYRFRWILRVRQGLESIWNSSGIHLDEFSAQEVEYGVFLKDFYDFEEFPNSLHNPEGRIGTCPNPDWDKSGLRPIPIGRNRHCAQSGLGPIEICPNPDWD